MTILDLIALTYAACGFALLLLVVIDVFWTAVSPRGAGPLTAKLGAVIWRGAQRLHRRWGVEWVVEMLGPLMVVGVVGIWMIFLWLGWSLVFSSQLASISAEDAPVDMTGRFYFVGYSLLTLGIGDYVPRPGWWQIATILASANGLTVATLGVTYILNVLESITEARGMASSFFDLGASSTEVLTRSWEGDGWGVLPDRLTTAAPDLALHSEKHQAFPVLHYFHSREARTSTVLRIVVITEAVHLLDGAVAPSARPPRSVTRPFLSAIDGYLEMLLDLYRHADLPDESELPGWDLEPLARAGIPLAAPDEITRYLDEVQERRLRLHQLVTSDGWNAGSVLHGHGPEGDSA